MARRRHENGIKYQQRIASEQRNRQPDPAPDAPIPPSVTQLFENVAPQPYTPVDPQSNHEPNEP
jgi:hypothetical protein